MRKSATRPSGPASITVGELISELCRWPDHAKVTFRCPHQNQEMHFHGVGGSSKRHVEIELDLATESAPVVAA
jgi:hypothetical protein